MSTLNVRNVVRFWNEPDQNIMKVEILHGNIIHLKKGDVRVKDLKILDNDSKNFVKLFNKRINKNLVNKVERIVDPEFTVIISMKNGKQYRIDSKQRISIHDGNLYETYNYIKGLLS